MRLTSEQGGLETLRQIKALPRGQQALICYSKQPHCTTSPLAPYRHSQQPHCTTFNCPQHPLTEPASKAGNSLSVTQHQLSSHVIASFACYQDPGGDCTLPPGHLAKHINQQRHANNSPSNACARHSQVRHGAWASKSFTSMRQELLAQQHSRAHCSYREEFEFNIDVYERYEVQEHPAQFGKPALHIKTLIVLLLAKGPSSFSDPGVQFNRRRLIHDLARSSNIL